MNFQYVVLGMVMLGGMTAGIINLWIKRRKEKQNLGVLCNKSNMKKHYLIGPSQMAYVINSQYVDLK